jgi:phage gp36-like protein
VSQYADPADLVPQAMPQAAADSFTEAEQLAALVAASVELDGDLNRRFTLPLTAWGEDVRRDVAVVAGYELLSGRGFDSADEGSAMLRRATAARARWQRIGKGELDPPGLIDSTVTTNEGGPVFVTSTRRGW